MRHKFARYPHVCQNEDKVMREDVSDPELLRRVSSDPVALDIFYRRHVERVIQFVARRSSTPSDVADAVADVFLSVIESGASYDPRRGEPVPWLLGIASHVVAQQRRDEQRRSRLDAQIAGRDLLDEDDYLRLEERIDAEREARKVQGALVRLSPPQRDVLDLIVTEGLSTAQAAYALGISSVTARMRLMRARKLIRGAVSPRPISVDPIKAKEAQP